MTHGYDDQPIAEPLGKRTNEHKRYQYTILDTCYELLGRITGTRHEGGDDDKELLLLADWLHFRLCTWQPSIGAEQNLPDALVFSFASAVLQLYRARPT